MARSTDPSDYQVVPVPVAAMRKAFPANHRISPHRHERDQLLYAVAGTMRVRALDSAWIVPPDRALYMPSGIEHEVAMRDRVEMRTLYIEPASWPGLPVKPAVFDIRALLKAAILALAEEPIVYDLGARGGHLAAIILDELARAQPLQLGIPMPRDPRLARLCNRLLDDPACPSTLERLSEASGASARTLARLFLRDCGMSFTAWRQRVRFHNALEALTSGEPVSSVATRNGYRSASAFTAAFRRVLGFTPSRSAVATRQDINRSAGGGPSRPVPARPLSSG